MERNNNNIILEQHEGIGEIFDTSTDSNSESSQKSCNSEKEYFNEKSDISRNSSVIKEVYSENLDEEMKIIKGLLEKEYNYIGMDTEFPGTVFSLKNLSDDFYYKTLQKNVNELKLIQLGITLTNKDGEYPKNIPYHTWQFNFKFNEEKDKYSEESLNLLKSTGIDFDKLKKDEIAHKKFGNFWQKPG